MANAWVEHVRKWSAANGVSYMCAISKPECKAAYKGGKAPSGKSKKPAMVASPAPRAPVTRDGKKITVRMPKKFVGASTPLVAPQPVADSITPSITDYSSYMKNYRKRNAIDSYKYPRMNQLD